MKDSYFYRSIVENTSVGYSYNKIIYDDNKKPIDYQLIEMNQAFESILDIKQDEWIGNRMSELYFYANKEPYNWKDYHNHILTKYIKKDLEMSFTHWNKYYKIKIYSPTTEYVIISLTDISTELKETEKIQTLFDNVPIQVWYLKNPTTYLSVNKVYADFVGCKSEDLICRNVHEVVSQERAKVCTRGSERVFEEKRKIVTDEWLKNYQGEKRLLRITKSPKLNARQEVEFVVCSAQDITDEYINKQKNEIQERILRSSLDFTQELLTNDNLNEALANGIEMLGNATKVDRVYYWENYYDGLAKGWFTSQKIEWCLDGVDAQINNPELQNVPFEKSVDFIGTLAQNKSFSSHIKDMIDGKNTTKQVLQAQGILSILVIPVFVKDEFRGFIGFDSCRFEKEWSSMEISLLNSFVLLYIKALEKSRLELEVKQTNDNFNNFFNMIQDLLVVLDREGTIIEVNNNVLKRLNYSKEELIGESYLIFHPTEEAKKVKSNFDDILANRNGYFKVPAITKEGHIFPIEMTNSKGLWNGQPVVFGVIKDVTELTLSEDKFSKAFNNSGVSMLISRFEDGKVLEVNDKFLDYMGYTLDEVIGKTTADLQMTQNYRNRKLFKKRITADQKISDVEIKLTTKDNKKRIGIINIVPLMINNEKCLLSSIIDISDRIKDEKKILDLSNRDELTNLYNRRFIYNSVDEIINKYKKNEEAFSVAILDIDNFKDINDQYGHQVGDSVLVEFSKIIDENLREYDVLGRYGGEEFIILLDHADRENSQKVLNRILEIVRDTVFTCGGHQIKLTFSAGLVSCEEFEKEELTIDQLVQVSDRRMYVAKQNGKDQVIFKG